jgi:CubicO group peptidase (beta-lactamase class C family)
VACVSTPERGEEPLVRGEGDPLGATRSFDFAELDRFLFEGKWKTEGVIVQRDGVIVHERYATGFAPGTRHMSYSVSKSIGAALVGIAVRDGVLRTDASVCTYVTPPAGASSDLCSITIDHLLRMTSGGAWLESYANPASDVLAMLYGDQSDMGAYVAGRPRAAPAGSKWLYSSGSSNLLALALKRALGGRDMVAWAQEKLFGPAGMNSVVFETDRSGTLVFSSSAFLTPRDMARFGQLYLGEGEIAGTRILSPEWVAYSQVPAPPVAQARGASYGAGFWLNTARPTMSPGAWMYPDAPADLYSAEGHWGQKIIVIPSKKLVVVRVGDDRIAPFEASPMLEMIQRALEGTPAGDRIAARGSIAPAEIEARRPASSDELLTGFSAKEACSCAFVVGQSDAYCEAFGRFEGVAIAVAIDRTARTVTSRFGTAARTARVARSGCLLDPLP